MEIQAALWWTPGFAERFESARGYSIIKYLPVMFHASNQWNAFVSPYNVTYTFGAYEASGGKYNEDYRRTLDECYRDYLAALEEWAETMGLSHSTQPAYNLPLDMVNPLTFAYLINHPKPHN